MLKNTLSHNRPPSYHPQSLFKADNMMPKTSSFKGADCSNELTWQRMETQNEWEGPRERVRPWGSGVGSAVHCSGVTSDNGPAVNGPAVTSRNCVLDPRKNETLDVFTSKVKCHFYFYIHGSVDRESNLITVQQDATYSVYCISVGSSTCFGYWHPSSGARTTVITASGTGRPGLLPSALVVEFQFNNESGW